MSEYSYKELKAAVIADRSNTAAVNELGEWFEMFGDRYWNGEYFDADDFRLYPIYEENNDGDFELIGYNLKF